MAGFLTLGGIVFQDMEIPERLKAGGAQALFTHKYPGGSRTVDTTGPDDDDITWSGLFLDGAAEARCQQIDGMRRQGISVSLAWSSFRYTVVISKFEFTYRRSFQIEYSITLVVVQDRTQPQTAPETDPEQVMQSDVATATANAAKLNNPALTSQVATVQASADSVPTIAGASEGFLQGFAVQIGSAVAAATAQVSTYAALVGSAGNTQNFAAGAPPGAMAANLLSLSAAATNLPIASDTVNRLVRLGKNVAAIGT